MLIFQNQFSSKAHLIYDLSECEIKMKVSEESRNIATIKTFSQVNINEYELRDSKCSTDSTDPSERSSSTSRNSNRKLKGTQQFINYQIVIEHPYLHKCLIKADNVFETMEFYNYLKLLVKN